MTAAKSSTYTRSKLVIVRINVPMRRTYVPLHGRIMHRPGHKCPLDTVTVSTSVLNGKLNVTDILSVDPYETVVTWQSTLANRGMDHIRLRENSK